MRKAAALMLFVFPLFAACTDDEERAATGAAAPGGRAADPASVWGAARTIDAGGPSDAPALASDPNGNAVAVWREFDGRVNHVWANRYIAGEGWGEPQLLERGAFDAQPPSVAMDAAGNAIAAWAQSDGDNTLAYASRFVPDAGWSPPEAISALRVPRDEVRVSDVRVAMDAAGRATAAWLQVMYETATAVGTNRFAPETGWQEQTLFMEAVNPVEIAVAMGGEGNAALAWTSAGAALPVMHLRYYSPAEGWAPTVAPSIPPDGRDTGPALAMDAAGNALAVWSHPRGGGRPYDRDIYASYHAGAGWSPPARVERDDGADALLPQVAFTGEGEAVALWNRFDGRSFDIFSAPYSLARGWGPAAPIESGPPHARMAQLAANPDGGGVAVWQQVDARADAFSAFFDPVRGWQPPLPLETGAEPVFAPQAAIDDRGHALAIWVQGDRIWASATR